MRTTALAVTLISFVACAAEPGSVHEAAAAGSFYPGNARELRETVHRVVAAAPRVTKQPVKAVLAPHAGYVYTAKVIAAAFRQLEPGFNRVVVIAGNHSSEAWFDGASVDNVSAYRVPGLEVKVSPAARALARQRLFTEVPAAHRMYMIEVELPFLAEVNQAPFELVPIIVGELTPSKAHELAMLLQPLADEKTRFVFSVDLSHYYPYDEAVARDRACLSALEAVDLERVGRCDTDATQVLRVMTELAALEGWTPKLIASANSGDVPDGERDRVVGYGAIAYEDVLRLTADEGAALLEVARRSVEASVQGNTYAVPASLTARLPRLALPRATFVTLNEKGQLRGCIGTLAADQALAASVAHSAENAALHDDRFTRVRPDELRKLAYTVSVLELPKAFDASGNRLLPALAERPGLVLIYQGRRSVFLPEVWDELPVPEQFLAHLCTKQGAPEDCWRSPQTRFERFTSQRFEAPALDTR